MIGDVDLFDIASFSRLSDNPPFHLVASSSLEEYPHCCNNPPSHVVVSCSLETYSEGWNLSTVCL